jgi:hypothetical protein
MTTDVRVRSSWVTLECLGALVNLSDKVPLHWSRTSPPSNTPTSRKNKASKTKE